MKLPSRRLLAFTSCAGLIFCIPHHGKCALVSVAHAAASGRQSAASLVASVATSCRSWPRLFGADGGIFDGRRTGVNPLQKS